MSHQVRFEAPLQEPVPLRRPDNYTGPTHRLLDARRCDLAFGCVDWFEYPGAPEGLPIAEITRVSLQPIHGESDETTGGAAANA